MRRSTSALLVLFLLSSAANAHDFPCGHDHLADTAGKIFLENTCNSQPSACGDACFQTTTRNNNTYCVCGRGDCETAFAGTFVPEETGLLQPNTQRTYIITTEGIEALSVLVEEIEVASFGPSFDDTFGPADSDALFGVTTLAFGSFDNQEAIPVTVTEFNVDLISLSGDGKESGLNIIGLRDDAPIDLIYNATANTFALADQEKLGIDLELQNDLAGNQPATLYFDGKFDADGNLAIFGQIEVNTMTTAISDPTWGAVKSSNSKRPTNKKAKQEQTDKLR